MHPSNRFFHQQQFYISQTKINKTLLIQSLESNFSQQYQVSIPYDSVARQLDIGHVLHSLFFQILNPNYQYQVFYFSNLNSCFIFADVYPWTTKFVLGQQFIPKQQIFIAFRKICLIDGISKTNQTALPQQNKKKRRINDRTIIQTLEKVSLWRSKCQQQKITFQQAAKQIDIPKKTLDDYYALIRTGQQYGFDFQKNYSQKIGVLRKFVKGKQKENKDIKQKKKVENKQKSEGIKQQQKQQVNQRKMSIIDKMILEDESQGEQQEE